MKSQVGLLVNSALQYFQGNNLATAEKFLRQAFTLESKDPEIIRLLGVVIARQGRFREAENLFHRAIKIAPQNALAYSNLGNIYLELGEYESAIEKYQCAIELDANYAEAYNNLGNVYQLSRQCDQAIVFYQRAIEIQPDRAEFYSNYGNSLNVLANYGDALNQYENAINIDPNCSSAWLGAGNTLLDLKRYNDALNAVQKAVALDPNLDWAQGTLVHLKMLLCDWRDFERDVTKSLAMVREGRRVSLPLGFLAITDNSILQLQISRAWVKSKYSVISKPIIRNSNPPLNQKIRIGYFSADFHNHAVPLLTAGMFEAHDRERFEIYAFSYGPDVHDEMRQRLTLAFDHFIRIDNLSDKDVVGLARQLGIDIAIDLMGHTQGARTGIFAQ
jgi:predicted O-linked N-acetylglucosamine transferase (SPINDLY family)